MRLYMTRRESEILLHCLYLKMKDVPMDELGEYHKITDRIIKVNSLQCQDDKSGYEEK